MNKTNNIEAQPGFQEEFLSTPADIAFGGGGAGVGKTHAEIMESVRHIDIKNFACVFFRRTYQQIAAPGALWDQSQKIYPALGATSANTTYTFPVGSKIVFSHMQHEKNKLDWQGSEIPLIIFDELTHFTHTMFFYMLSRNRSTCGVKPYMRATCNPDADSWVRDFIEWYIDEDGYIIPERSGVIRYLTVHNDVAIWGDTREEVMEKAPHLESLNEVLSFTFIEGDLEDNQILLDIDKSYKSKLLAMSEEDQLRLLKRNWNVKIDKTTIINAIKFKDTFTNDFVPRGKKYITADIATRGSDIFSIWIWEGKRAIDLILIGSNNGKQAVQAIQKLQKIHFIPDSRVAFDADGVGGGMTGWLDNAIEFHGNGKVFGKENYTNRRAQMYFNLADCINETFPKTANDCYYISPEIIERPYPFDTPKIYKGKSIKWCLLHQIKGIKQLKPDADGKKAIIPKDEMKPILGGISPDLLDSLSMREIFDFIGEFGDTRKTKADLGIF